MQENVLLSLQSAGLCKGCACAKASHLCINCQPIRLGVCQNVAGCLASTAQSNKRQQTVTCVNGLLLETEEEISPIARVNSCLPSPTLNTDSTFAPGLSSASSTRVNGVSFFAYPECGLNLCTRTVFRQFYMCERLVTRDGRRD